MAGKKLLDAKGPFGDNVIKNPAEYSLSGISISYQPTFNYERALKMSFDNVQKTYYTMLDGLLAITFRFKSNLLNNLYHTQGVFLTANPKTVF